MNEERISLTISTLGLPLDDFAIGITDGKCDRIDALLDRIVDQLCICLDATKSIFEGRDSAVTTKSD